MDTNLMTGFSEYSPDVKAIDAVKKCRKLGLTAVQLSGDFYTNFPENINEAQREEVREYILENNIHLHYHAPGDIPLASRHEKLRLSGLERLGEYIKLAIDMGAVSFIFHPGRFAFYRIGSKRIIMARENIPQPYIKRFYDSASFLASCSDGKLHILLENTYSLTGQIIDVIDRFLEIPDTGLVWDIGHTNSGNYRNQAAKNQQASFFSERLKFIRLAHIHDSSGNKSHLPLGKGSLDITSYVDIFRTLNIEMIIEVFSDNDLKTSLEYLKSIEIQNCYD